MKKTFELTTEQFNAILGKEGKKRMDALNESMSDMGRQIAADQMAWVDKCMQDILPPAIYEDAKHQRNLDAVEAYVRRHKIKIVHMMDTLRMRIMIGEQIYGEWKANLHVDGEPVEFKPTN